MVKYRVYKTVSFDVTGVVEAEDIDKAVEQFDTKLNNAMQNLDLTEGLHIEGLIHFVAEDVGAETTLIL